MSTHLSPEDRLAALRAADLERHWDSLDDKRICLICKRTFSGRQVEITKRGAAYGLQCPTQDCPSSCNHWFLIHPRSKKEAVVEVGEGHVDSRFFLP